MKDESLGTLDRRDPLFEILAETACPDVRDPSFLVRRLSSRDVYRYTEEKSRTAIIGKFFKLDDPRADRVSRIQGEYDNLLSLRRLGFSAAPNYVVRPLGRELRIGLALIEEYISGKDLDHFIRAAIYHGERSVLRERLARLASFLHALHSRTAVDSTVRLESLSVYFRKLLDRLGRQTVIDDRERGRLLRLMETWLGRPVFQGLRETRVHGDATPTNFLFSSAGDVVAIDLERMKETDAVYDVGMVCGELKHAFLWRTGNPYEAEPFIRHFLKCYAGHSPDRDSAFHGVTARNPFYMAMTELRIARNRYLDWDYRKRLAHEATECLRWGLRLS